MIKKLVLLLIAIIGAYGSWTAYKEGFVGIQTEKISIKYEVPSYETMKQNKEELDAKVSELEKLNSSGIPGAKEEVKLEIQNYEAKRKEYENWTLRATPEEIGECPICGKDIIEGKRGFGCSGYKEGCKFVLWKEKSGKVITLSQAQRLLKGETIALKGFTAEDGTNFDSKIKLVPTDDPANPYKVDFVKTEKKTKKKSE